MQNYKLIKVIGKGSFGEVTKAIDTRTNKVRAIKKIKKSALQKEKGVDKDKEYEILTKLVSPIRISYIFIYYIETSKYRDFARIFLGSRSLLPGNRVLRRRRTVRPDY